MYNREAQNLARQGRYGDSTLVHMNPREVAGLAALARAHGKRISINPKTGLPEAWDLWEELGNLGSSIDKRVTQPILQEVDNAVEWVAKTFGPLGQIGAAYFGGPIGAAIYSGFADPDDDFNWKNAAKSAALTYAGQGITQGMGGAPTGAETGAFDMAGAGTGIDAAAGLPGMAAEASGPMLVDAGVNAAPSGVEVSSIPGGEPSIAAPAPTPVSAPAPAYVETAPPNNFEMGQAGYNYGLGAPITAPAEVLSGVGAGTPTPSVGQGLANLGEALGERAINYAVDNPLKTAGMAYTGYTAYKTKQEIDAAKEEAERILRDQKARTAREIAWANEVMATYPTNLARLTAADVEKYGIGTKTYAMGGNVDPYDDELGTDDVNAAQGGLMGLARGGMPPRFLSGGGDGMSDSIPARIAGKQEARLADGEFVVPADVVSHIGNGSSKAGAKKLYEMMDRARQARTGRKRQAPAIKAERVMPA